MRFLVLSVAILVSFAAQANCLQTVRGIYPERASLYDSSKKFTCLDGSGVIPFDQVNDDYCDCRDGSDEPGTSACLNGLFACENLGYVVQPIPSSRVNDGICDCCDGSDEYNGKVKCENKCDALAAKMREEEEKLRLLREQGHAKRKELIEQGNELKKVIQAQIDDLEAQKAKVQTVRTQLEAKKTEVEQKAKEAKDKQDQIIEERKKEQERQEKERKARLLFDQLDINKDLLLSAEELLTRQELDTLFDNDGKFTIEESIKFLDEKQHVSYEIFSTVYFEKISPHLRQEEEAKPSESTQAPADKHEHGDHHHEHHDHEHGEDLEEEHVEEHDHHHDEHDHEHHHEHDHEQQHEQHHQQQHQQQESEQLYDEETRNLLKQAEDARTEFDNYDRDFREIESKLNDAKKKLEIDVGPNAEFAFAIDKCFEMEDREYIYKLCPFDRTVQKSKSNQGETVIGYWKSWGEEGSNKYLSMRFDNGLACWNGPSRSTNVFLSCGIESKLTAVSEPNRCEYEMHFETPAVCEENQINSSQNSHEEL